LSDILGKIPKKSLLNCISLSLVSLYSLFTNNFTLNPISNCNALISTLPKLSTTFLHVELKNWKNTKKWIYGIVKYINTNNKMVEFNRLKSTGCKLRHDTPMPKFGKRVQSLSTNADEVWWFYHLTYHNVIIWLNEKHFWYINFFGNPVIC